METILFSFTLWKKFSQCHPIQLGVIQKFGLSPNQGTFTLELSYPSAQINKSAVSAIPPLGHNKRNQDFVWRAICGQIIKPINPSWLLTPKSVPYRSRLTYNFTQSYKCSRNIKFSSLIALSRCSRWVDQGAFHPAHGSFSTYWSPEEPMQLVHGGIYSRRHQYLKAVVINCGPITFLLITLLISNKPGAGRESIFYLLSSYCPLKAQVIRFIWQNLNHSRKNDLATAYTTENPRHILCISY